MNFTVIWFPQAEDDLTTAWLDSDRATRRAITAATNYIDRLLRANPLDVGEGREGIDRIVFHSPLAMVFEVLEDDRLVRVREVWRIA